MAAKMSASRGSGIRRSYVVMGGGLLSRVDGIRLDRTSVRLMLHASDDLTNPLDVESLRRSVAMLPPGQAALDREASLKVLDELQRQLERANGQE